jgi:hypothetical protein
MGKGPWYTLCSGTHGRSGWNSKEINPYPFCGLNFNFLVKKIRWLRLLG